MDGEGLRARRPNKEHNDDIQSRMEEEESKKICGRTPDGTGESVIQCLGCKLVRAVSWQRQARSKGRDSILCYNEKQFAMADMARQ